MGGRIPRLSRAIAVMMLTGVVAGPTAAQTRPAGPIGLPRLINGDSLASLLKAGQPILLDTRSNWIEYLQNHLPGAEWVSAETFRATQGGLPFQLLSPSSYEALWSRLGVRDDRPVVVYSAGETMDMEATLIVWLLATSGHRQTYLLDGGYAKWATEGRPLSQKFPRLQPSRFRVSAFRPDTASLDEVRRAVAQKDVLLVDARKPEQFAGNAGPQPRRGHIPGAVDHPWQNDMERRDLALVWKSMDDLRAGYDSQGITPDRDIILYCNSSTEVTHIFFALRYLLGYPRVRIYMGSWSQWAERDDLPIETGP